MYACVYVCMCVCAEVWLSVFDGAQDQFCFLLPGSKCCFFLFDCPDPLVSLLALVRLESALFTRHTGARGLIPSCMFSVMGTGSLDPFCWILLC